MHKRGEMNASKLGREVGVSHVTIGNYLVGKPPKSVHLVSIAKFLNVSTDWLLGLVGESMFDEHGGIKRESKPPIPLRMGEGQYAEIELWKRRAENAEKELIKLRSGIRELLSKPNSAIARIVDEQTEIEADKIRGQCKAPVESPGRVPPA